MLLPKSQCIIMTSKGPFKFACFEFAKNAQACLIHCCRISYRCFESLSRSYPVPLYGIILKQLRQKSRLVELLTCISCCLTITIKATANAGPPRAF